ncbi:hypothetical protein SKAU_G00321100, partial [Synaphobranchus kaupii]
MGRGVTQESYCLMLEMGLFSPSVVLAKFCPVVSQLVLCLPVLVLVLLVELDLVLESEVVYFPDPQEQ